MKNTLSIVGALNAGYELVPMRFMEHKRLHVKSRLPAKRSIKPIKRIRAVTWIGEDKMAIQGGSIYMHPMVLNKFNKKLLKK